MLSKCHCGKSANSEWKSKDGYHHCTKKCLKDKGRERSEEAMAKKVSSDGSGIPTNRARRRDGAESDYNDDDDDDDDNNERGSHHIPAVARLTLILFACSKRSREVPSTVPRTMPRTW